MEFPEHAVFIFWHGKPPALKTCPSEEVLSGENVWLWKVTRRWRKGPVRMSGQVRPLGVVKLRQVKSSYVWLRLVPSSSSSYGHWLVTALADRSLTYLLPFLVFCKPSLSGIVRSGRMTNKAYVFHQNEGCKLDKFLPSSNVKMSP